MLFMHCHICICNHVLLMMKVKIVVATPTFMHCNFLNALTLGTVLDNSCGVIFHKPTEIPKLNSGKQ